MEKLAIFGGKKIAKDDEMRFNWPRITNDTEKVIIKQLHEAISIYDNSGIFGEFEKNLQITTIKNMLFSLIPVHLLYSPCLKLLD